MVVSPRDICNFLIETAYDVSLAVQKISDYLVSLAPRAISFYCVCDSFPLTVLLASAVAARSENIFIIMSGPHASALKEEILNTLDFVDLVAYSEGEKMIENLLLYTSGKLSITQVLGIAYRTVDGIRINSPPQLLNSDELAEVLYSEITNENGSDWNILLEGGRGCPFQCTYCLTSTYWGRVYRVIDPERLAQLVIMQHEIGNSRIVGIVHDHFTYNRRFVTSFCNYLIQESTNVRWTCSARVDSLDPELIDLMIEAGCISVYLGIETGSKSMQKKIQKNLDLDSAISIINYTANRKVKVIASFIMGFPSESKEEFFETIALISQLLFKRNVDIQLHFLEFYPKTTETLTVFNDLYFDQHALDHLMEKGGQINSDTIPLIETNKILYSSYYNYNTEVRSNFSRFPFFLLMIQTAKDWYCGTLAHLLRETTLMDLYVRFHHRLGELIAESRGIYDERRREQFFLLSLELLLDSYMIPKTILFKIFSCEKLVRKISQRERSYFVIKPGFDLLFIRSDAIYRESNVVFLLYSRNNKTHITKLRDEDHGNSLVKLLEKNGYCNMRSPT